MDKRALATNGPQVSAIGLGCMSMTDVAGMAAFGFRLRAALVREMA